MKALGMIWGLMGKGGWVLVVAGVAGGWYHGQIAAARREGAKQAELKQLQAHVDSLNANLVFAVSYIRRDSSLLAAERRDLDLADQKLRQAPRIDSSASWRADSLLAHLRDSLPQLAGQLDAIGAAKDSIQQLYQGEHSARVIAERMVARYASDLSTTLTLLDKAKGALASQAAAIQSLQGRHVSPLGFGCGAGPSIGTKGFQPAAVSCGVTLRF